MAESLRDRVARVLYEKNPALRWSGEAWPFDEVLDSTQAILAYEEADALIAAGLITPGHKLDDSEGSAFCSCGAGPFPNFAVSPLPYFQRHLRELTS